MPKHTDVIHDWRATVTRWLLMPFSQDFLVIPIKKSDTSVKYKKQSILLITNKSHKAHLLSCA